MPVLRDAMPRRVANVVHELLAHNLAPVRNYIMEEPGALDVEVFVDAWNKARIKVKTQYGPRHFVVTIHEKVT